MLPFTCYPIRSDNLYTYIQSHQTRVQQIKSYLKRVSRLIVLNASRSFFGKRTQSPSTGTILQVIYACRRENVHNFCRVNKVGKTSETQRQIAHGNSQANFPRSMNSPRNDHQLNLPQVKSLLHPICFWKNTHWWIQILGSI